MRLFVRLAVLGIALTSVAGQILDVEEEISDIEPLTIDFDTRNCTQCPPCYNNDLMLPINYGKISCGYCLCRPHKEPLIVPCGDGKGFDDNIGKCVPMAQCDKACIVEDCPPCYHGMDYKVPNHKDPCKYCLCLDDGGIMEMECEDGYGWNEHTYQCEPNELCGCHENCENVTCDPCYHGMQMRHPNPINICSFCCCLPDGEDPDHEIAMFKPCPLRHEFDPVLKTCVPTDKDICETTPPEHPCSCTDCQGVVCDPAHYGESVRHVNIADQCTFCCCVIQEDGSEKPEVRSCEDVIPGSRYDKDLQKCVPSDICPDNGKTNCTEPPPTLPPPCKSCADIPCPPKEYGTHYLFENPRDKCSFCCCIEDVHHPGREIAVEKSCASIDENSEYDPITKKCVPSSVCPGDGKPWYCP